MDLLGRKKDEWEIISCGEIGYTSKYEINPVVKKYEPFIRWFILVLAWKPVKKSMLNPS